MSRPGPLVDALRATGFLINGEPAPGLLLEPSHLDVRTSFRPDAVWRDRSQLEVVFKYADGSPSSCELASWHRDVWNLGVAPLLWVVSPKNIDLYNAYERPISVDDASSHLLRHFRLVENELASLDDYAGRLAMASGGFWDRENRVRRDGRVDAQLLRDLQEVERKLCAAKLPREVAQALLGRCIFVRYLTDRGIVGREILQKFGAAELNEVLQDHALAYRLFDWVRSTFNGDLFPISTTELQTVKPNHLQLVADILAGTDPITGQMSLWPYRFEVIPIELISSIYEQFAHGTEAAEADIEGLHYTPISVVNLILDEVMRDAPHKSRVLDLTCGSGVFLVEALRRLVYMRAGGEPIRREFIREILRNQIFGVDKNESAINIASFSLYLAALELGPDPTPPEALRFEPLIGRNLFIADAFELDRVEVGAPLKEQRFDIIVGNPPWTYRGGASQRRWPPDRKSPPLPPRSEDFAFVWRSLEFANEHTRFGIVMRATPFFSGAKSSVRARNALLEALAPVALVNLAALRDELFPTADYPAMILLARLDEKADPELIPIVTVQWTRRFAQSGAFEIAPSDLHTAYRAEIESSSTLLKVLALGTPRDRLLLGRLKNEAKPLSQVLATFELKLLVGIQTLAGDRNDAAHLIGMPFLGAGQLEFELNSRALPKFNLAKIHRPRHSAAFRGPLVLIGEGLDNGRAAVGISLSDVVYSRSFYGISFAGRENEVAPRLAGVLLSAMTSWQLLLTAAEFGIHKRKLLLQDIEGLVIPPHEILVSPRGAPISNAFRALAAAAEGNNARELADLDRVVFDLYDLGEDDRLVVLDGLARARREYVEPRMQADQPATVSQLRAYARAFLRAINAWQSALKRNGYGAEILALRSGAPLRVIRFIEGKEGDIREGEVDADLNEVLQRIGRRIRLPIAERLAAVRELRVHADRELLIIKPVARRFWTAASGLNDADSALGDSLGGAAE